MKTLLMGAATILAAAPAMPASAQDAAIDDSSAIVVESPLLHPAAGMMNEHMHEGGEFMFGLRFERSHSGGTNQSGSEAIADAAVLAAGFTSRTTSMTMDMVMLDLMYAPSDDITFMLMPQYMWHRMEMLGIDPMAGDMDMDMPMEAMDDGHGGHDMLGYGQTHSHGTEGFGDTLVSASYRLMRKPGLGAHATLGVWIPTGADDLTNADGTFVHYGMQPGSGTWDVEPSLTLKGTEGAFGWGVQTAYRMPLEGENSSGFRFGDRFRATGWTSYLVSNDVGLTGRIEYANQGQVEGHYNAGHHHAAPPDRQENYGGDTLTAAVGINLMLPGVSSGRPQLGIELAHPLYQDLNGIQAPADYRLSVALSGTF